MIAYPGTVRGVDGEWVLAKIDEFLSLLDQHRGTQANTPSSEELGDQIKAMLPVMERIASAVEPGRPQQWRASGGVRAWPWHPARDTAIRLRTIVVSQAEVDAALGPGGPQLAASGLHPGVWGAAAQLWDNGHLREAVQAAATHIELTLKAKIDRRDLTGKDLPIEAFKLDPPKPGERRLRFTAHQEGSANYKSRHEGAMFFGAGVMQAIRNPATHDLAQPDEQVALEYLAALSVLARWIDGATVVHG
jgi:hypothetical protein